MLRWFAKMLAMGVFIAAGSVTIWYYHDQTAIKRELFQAQEQNRVLQRIVERLGDENRVAEVLVTEQKSVNGHLQTSLLFVEYDKAGKSLTPRSFVFEGDWAHIDAMVIQFDRGFVEEGDPLRGHSIALFTRLFGDKQAPENGFPIDAPGRVPEVCRSDDPRVTQFEQDLWKQFWKLADDPKLRAEKGVRIASGQGVWGRFEPGRLYTITLAAAGGISITSVPLDGIYREALKQPATTATAP